MVRHFVCLKKEGCRISDLNLNLIKDQIFEREDEIVQTSRGLKAAEKSEWIKEISEKEFKEIKKKKETELSEKQEINVSKEAGQVQG